MTPNGQATMSLASVIVAGDSRNYTSQQFLENLEAEWNRPQTDSGVDVYHDRLMINWISC